MPFPSVTADRPARLLRRDIVLLALVSALAPSAAWGQDATPAATALPADDQAADDQAFLALVEQRMASVQSVVASFVQEQELALFERTLTTTGVIAFARPDRLRWEIRAPFRSLLVVSGEQVAKFEELDGHRRELELGRARGMLMVVMGEIRAWFQGRFEASSERYAIAVVRGERPGLVLTPRDRALSGLAAIEVELSATLDGVRQVVVRERSGDRTVMRFTDVSRDRALPDAWFDVRDPAVLDDAALGIVSNPTGDGAEQGAPAPSDGAAERGGR